MTTVRVDGLIALASAVRADFALRAVTMNGVLVAVPPVGLKSRSLWTFPRVVFIPGKFDGVLPPKPLEEGRLVPPEHTKADNPRELVTWERISTISVYASDKTDVQNEELQISACTWLLEQALQSMVNAYTPNLKVPEGDNREFGFTGQGSLAFDSSPVTRVYPPVEFPHGAELLVSFTQRGPLFDVLLNVVTPTVQVITKTFHAPPS